MADRPPQTGAAVSSTTATEADMIAHYFAPLAATEPGAFSLQDDCAMLAVPPGFEVVVTTDAVVEGTHLPTGAMPGDLSWKSLAVNVSDLVAKGARPSAYTMQLTLGQRPTAEWLQAFCTGLSEAQSAFGCRLLGGDTDVVAGSGNAVSITAFGLVAPGAFVRRSGASVGDALVVTGVIGDAALGLALSRDPDLARRAQISLQAASALRAAQLRPQPRLAIAEVVRRHATASMDVSDGLAKDAKRLCETSRCGGVLHLADMPVSPAAATLLAAGEGFDATDLATAGEDYVVLAAVAADHIAAFRAAAEAAGAMAAQVGEVLPAAEGFTMFDADRTAVSQVPLGWDHLRT